MENEAKVRIRKQISTEELERRWEAVRQVMREKKLDFLITQCSTDFLGGYIRWFTDIPTVNNYTATLIFPQKDDMTTIFHGPNPPAEPSPVKWNARGIKKRISVPALPSIEYSTIWQAEKAVDELKKYKDARIGFVGMGFITAAFYNYLTKNLPNSVKFEEVTDFVDEIKAVKSPEEIECIKEATAIQEATFEYVISRIRPGKREYHVYMDIREKVTELGGEQGIVTVGSAPAGTPCTFHHLHYCNRMIEEGDTVHFMIETNGPSGLYGETMRTACVGKAPSELLEQYELVLEAQKVTLDMVKPGADPEEIYEANNAFMRKHGYPEEKRIYCHGQGYDLVERPSMNPGEKLKIKAGMNITIHPTIASAKASAQVCDNFIVQEKGPALRLHTAPHKIWIV